jgi:hypothetical protein
VVTLILAVFSWGVQYKLSLYDIPAKKSVSLPHAKLLSQKERPRALSESASNTTQESEGRSTTLFVCVFLAFLGTISLSPALQGLSSRDTFPSDRSDRRPHLSFFFFRPPPALAPSR